jgi:hypothetical protein
VRTVLCLLPLLLWGSAHAAQPDAAREQALVRMVRIPWSRHGMRLTVPGPGAHA